MERRGERFWREEEMAKQVVAITGASNGMGMEAARLFASRGWVVYGGARRAERIPSEANIHAIRLDVTDEKSNEDFIGAIIKAEGRLDVLINNAGYGEYGPLEEIPMEKFRAQFETNLFGAAHLAQLAIPIMREQRSGRIINISSIGEDVFTPLGGVYHATKAALRRWSNVLDMEVKRFGIRSIIVQPGGTRSDWASIAMENAEKNLGKDSPYRGMVKLAKDRLTGGSSMATAASADLAKVFYEAATDRKPKYAYFNSVADRLVARLARVHPRIFIAAADRLIERFARKVE